jgi:hypothetical protein
MNVKKRSVVYDDRGNEIEIIREGIQLDSVRFKELSRVERRTGNIKKSIANFRK